MATRLAIKFSLFFFAREAITLIISLDWYLGNKFRNSNHISTLQPLPMICDALIVLAFNSFLYLKCSTTFLWIINYVKYRSLPHKRINRRLQKPTFKIFPIKCIEHQSIDSQFHYSSSLFHSFTYSSLIYLKFIQPQLMCLK